MPCRKRRGIFVLSAGRKKDTKMKNETLPGAQHLTKMKTVTTADLR